MKQKYAVNKINIVVDTVKMVNYDLIIIETILNDKKGGVNGLPQEFSHIPSEAVPNYGKLKAFNLHKQVKGGKNRES
jgi:hypothetical protein